MKPLVYNLLSHKSLYRCTRVFHCIDICAINQVETDIMTVWCQVVHTKSLFLGKFQLDIGFVLELIVCKEMYIKIML